MKVTHFCCSPKEKNVNGKNRLTTFDCIEDQGEPGDQNQHLHHFGFLKNLVNNYREYVQFRKKFIKKTINEKKK